ncbi:MAG: hypothetical protein K9M80_01895 [Candidatus Marinimicrobia bacterium]|nr:hypothetical protein [Candidatus Neomarinimicrobiota bacterium]
MKRDVNIPSEKCISDVDPARFKPGDFTFPTLNMRIINLEGKGYVCTNYPGNKSDNGADGELFSVPNATCVGGVAYNGILYILSFNSDNEGEIGCYPSPVSWNANNVEFENTYKPLHVWDEGSGVTDLITDKIEFSTERNYNIVTKLLFDGTLNLYISDYTLPSFVVNTGFDQEGRYVITNHTLTPDKLKGQAQIIQGSQQPMQSSLVDVEKGGKLQSGNYYIYFCYQDSFYNQTRYYSILYPVSIYEGDEWNSMQGFRDKDKDGILLHTNKKIRIKLEELDQSYDSVFVGIVRYSAEPNAYPIADAYGIDKEYRIDGSDMEILIDGYEPKIIKSLSDFSLYMNYTISKSQKVFKKRNWVANWKRIDHDRDALKEFANLITVLPEFEDVGDNKLEHYIDGGGSFMQFQDEKKIVDKLSHAHGEIYPYAVQFLFTDGTYSDEAYPIRGADMIDLIEDSGSITGFGNINNESTPYKGLVRFPQIEDHINRYDKVIEQRQALGLRFKLGSALAYRNSNPDLFKNVKGYRIMRGQRIKNLIYQGFVYNTTNRVGNIPTNVKPNGITHIIGSDDASSYYFPIFGKEDGVKQMNKTFPIVWYKGDQSTKLRYRCLDSYIDKKHFALFSPDLIVELNRQLSNGESVYIKPIYAFDKASFDPKADETTNSYWNSLSYDFNNYEQMYGTTSVSTTEKSILSRHFYNPSWFGVHLSQEYPNISAVNQSYIKMRAYNVQKGMHKGPGNFSSWISDGEKGGDPAFNHKFVENGDDSWIYNRSNQAVDYLGLVSEDGEVDLELKMVNVYLNKNDIAFYSTTKNRFNPRDEFYFPVEDFRLMEKYVKFYKLFKGDTFIQRTAFRTNRWYGTIEYDKWGTAKFLSLLYKDVLYYHGFLLSLMTENFNNVQARQNVIGTSPGTNNTVEYSFWPNVINSDARQDTRNWVVESTDVYDLYEALSLNSGYSKINPDPLHQGYDADKLRYPMKFLTRIYHSNPQVNSEIADSFRQILPESYQDFLNHGGIMGLVEMNGRLVSIQKNSIELHHVSEKQLINEQNQERIMVGKSYFLSPESIKLSDLGVHHSKAFVEGLSGVYGVHWMRSSKIIWKIMSDGQSFQVIDLARNKLFKSEFKKYIDTVSDLILEDKILQGNGIIVWQDKEYGEINFTFLKKAEPLEIPIPINTNDYLYDSTVVYKNGSICYHNNQFYYSISSYNKDNQPGINLLHWIPFNLSNAQNFDNTQTYGMYTVLRNNPEGIVMVLIDPYNPATQKTVNNLMEFNTSDPKNYIRCDLYSQDTKKTFVFDEYLDNPRGANEFYPSLIIQSNDYTYLNKSYDSYLKDKIYQQNITDNDYLNFFNEDKKMKVSFYVTGEQSKAALFEKIFESLEITSSEETVEKIEFETENQYSALAPFIDPNKYWQNPEYKMNKWHIPIPIQSSSKKGEFDTGSNIAGMWMKVTITYSGKSLIHLKDIITNLNIKET